MNYLFVDGSRDSQMLLYKNYLYLKHNSYWKCREKACGVLVKLKNEAIEPDNPKHCHFEVTDCELKCLKAIKTMKYQASVTRMNVDISVIYNEQITNLTTREKLKLEEIHQFIKPYKKLRSTLCKCREKNKEKIPKSQEELELTGDYLLTNEHCLFMRYDNNNFSKRI